MWSHILRRPCGDLQKLEEFNRKASVRSIAGRRAAIVRAPTVNRCVVRVPCGCRAGAMRWSTSNCICARQRRSGGTRRTGSLRCCGGISAIFKRFDYDMQCSCPCIYIYIQRDGICSRREMVARENLASQGRRREPGRQPPGVLHISRDPTGAARKWPKLLFLLAVRGP